jgi:hypothetical protein
MEAILGCMRHKMMIREPVIAGAIAGFLAVIPNNLVFDGKASERLADVIKRQVGL